MHNNIKDEDYRELPQNASKEIFETEEANAGDNKTSW